MWAPARLRTSFIVANPLQLHSRPQADMLFSLIAYTARSTREKDVCARADDIIDKSNESRAKEG